MEDISNTVHMGSYRFQIRVVQLPLHHNKAHLSPKLKQMQMNILAENLVYLPFYMAGRTPEPWQNSNDQVAIIIITTIKVAGLH